MRGEGTKPADKPCGRCGCMVRYVANGACPECNKKYSKAWAAAHPEGRRDHSVRAWRKKAGKAKQYRRVLPEDVKTPPEGGALVERYLKPI